MLQPLDGPSKQYKVTVTTGTVRKIEEIVSGGAMEERQVVTLQPLTGRIRVYFGDGDSTPSAGTVSSDGMIQYNKSKESYEASETQDVFIVADSGSVDVIVIERA